MTKINMAVSLGTITIKRNEDLDMFVNCDIVVDSVTLWALKLVNGFFISNSMYT